MPRRFRSAPLGCGLEGVLQQRRDVLSGIVNGVDYREWNPATDPHLPANYDGRHVRRRAKPACKAALQSELGLPAGADAPLVAFVGRLADQKGIDLVAAVDARLGADAATCSGSILGTGEPKYHEQFAHAGRAISAKGGRAAGVLQRAGPSHRGRRRHLPHAQPLRAVRAEPALQPASTARCRSCAPPAAWPTRSPTPTRRTLAAGTANGFSFREYSPLALAEALARACDAYRQPEVWQRLVRTGMRQDWSWARSAKQYVELYRADDQPGAQRHW